jgi:beta-galactosidase
MWGIFSNVSARTDDPVPYIRELNTLARSLDRGRLTAASSVQDGDINFITDIVSFDLSLGWSSGFPDEVVPWLSQLRSGWPDLRAGLSYSAGASIFDQSEQLERPSPTSNFHPEGWQTFFHEEYVRNAVDAQGMWGVFVGEMFDSGAAKSAFGALAVSPTASTTGAINDHGLVTFDRKDRKDAFWLYKACWNTTDPFAHIVGSRLDTRSDRRQTIRVYSNLPETELFLNGRSQGDRTSEGGVFVWEDVNMRPGINRIEARATGTIAESSAQTGSVTVTDRASVNITSRAVIPSRPNEVSTTESSVPIINPIIPEQTVPRRTVNPR